MGLVKQHNFPLSEQNHSQVAKKKKKNSHIRIFRPRIADLYDFRKTTIYVPIPAHAPVTAPCLDTTPAASLAVLHDFVLSTECKVVFVVTSQFLHISLQIEALTGKAETETTSDAISRKRKRSG